VAFLLFKLGIGGGKLMKRMTPATRLLLDALKGKYEYFSKRNKLADDGSFYCLDKYLMEQLGIGDNTIRRARIYLKEIGEIDYAIGKHKGAPTRYWIMPKGAKMASFGEGVKQAKMEPFERGREAKMAPFNEDLKGANLSPKGANLVVKGGQFGSLNNKLLIKIENKNMPEEFPSVFTEESKEGVRAFAKMFGVPRARIFWADKGYNSESIRQILESLEEQKCCLKA